MRHRYFGNQLHRPTNQAKALYRSLASEVLDHGRIQTTLPKAKSVVGLIDKLISFGKRGDLTARREVIKLLGGTHLTDKLFTQIAPTFKDRPSGYTRIIKLGKRFSDSAEMVYLELVNRTEASSSVSETVPAVTPPESEVTEMETKPEVKKSPKATPSKTKKNTKATKKVTKKE